MGGGYGLSYGHGYGGYVRSYYGKREAEPTAVAEAEADPYYRSYGYGGHGLSYRTYTRSYPVVSYGRRYGGYGLSYGGYGGYGRSYYGKREAEAEATFRKNRKRYRSYGYGRSYGGYGRYYGGYGRSYGGYGGYYGGYGHGHSSYYY